MGTVSAPATPDAARAGPPASRTPEILVRRGLLLVAAAAALSAAFAGLARVGFDVAWGPSFAGSHGALFVLAVFGTVISLERAVALGGWAGLLAPGLSAAAAVLMLAGVPGASWVAAASALALAGINAIMVKRQPAPFTWLMLLGAGTLVVGDVAWALSQPAFAVVPAWVGFFVLTIVAERLELSRLAPTPRWAARVLVVVATVFAAAACASLTARELALPVLGVSMAALGLWQLRFDLSRYTVRQRGLPRFSAVGVLSGALWLVAGGALFAIPGLPVAGPRNEAALHTVFVGYVLSMVFAHAPITLSSVARVRLVFHPALYLGLLALHASLLVRVLGSLVESAALRHWGALANALALVVFALAVVWARLSSRRPISP